LDEPGVTRDRHYGPFSIDGQAFLLMDTGGVQDVDHLNNTIDLGMQAQVEKALLEADILFIVLDGREGPTEGDKYLVEKIRPLNREKLIFYLVNKMDHSSQDQDLFNFYELGVSPFFPISAEHKKGIDALKEEVLAQWQAGHGLRSSEDLTFLGTDNNAVRLTLLGRPNVGK
jgi:GTP-binding protein